MDDRTRPAAPWGQGPAPGMDDRTRADRRTTSASGEWGPRRFQPGAQVGDFVLEQKLGQGGMGAVFVARHLHREQRVALKVLLVEQDDLRDEELERFRREGQAQAAVDAHPNVLRVINQGTHEGYPFLVTELASGGDLKARLKLGSMEPRTAAELVGALARGLAHVHARGVLHRDLKPGNVVFGEDDVPKLMDFGLARLQGARRLTQTGATMGTPAYMAPEQAAGERIDERADVYGLGAILYECLTGRAPFEGTSDIGIIKQVLTDEVEPPRALRPDLPADLDAVVVRALAREPEGRYPSAAAFADDLERFVAGRRVEARPRGGARRALAALGAVAVVGALGAVAAWTTSGSSDAAVASPPSPGPARPRATITAVSGETRLVRRGERADVASVVPNDGAGTTWHLASASVDRVDLAAVVTRPSVSARVTLHRSAAAAPPAEELTRGEHDVSLRRADGPWVTVELLSASRAVARVHVLWLPEGVALRPGPRLVLERTGAELVLVTPGEVRLAQLVLALDSRIEGEATRGGAIQVERPALVARNEATWAEYRAYAAATAAPLPTTAPEDGRLPVTDVLVQEAEAYCRWAGGRLPTFPEWYRAARGATTHRFPWGDRPEPPPPGRPWAGEPLANFGGAEDGFEGLAPVGSFPEGASPFGCLDMVGNVMEFVQSPPRDGSAPQLNAGSAFTKVDLADRVLDRAFADPPERRMPNTGFRLLVDVLPR